MPRGELIQVLPAVPSSVLLAAFALVAELLVEIPAVQGVELADFIGWHVNVPPEPASYHVTKVDKCVVQNHAHSAIVVLTQCRNCWAFPNNSCDYTGSDRWHSAGDSYSKVMTPSFEPIHHRKVLSHTGYVWEPINKETSSEVAVECDRLVREGCVVFSLATTPRGVCKWSWTRAGIAALPTALALNAAFIVPAFAAWALLPEILAGRRAPAN